MLFYFFAAALGSFERKAEKARPAEMLDSPTASEDILESPQP
jgi:hypothetical protein